MNQEKQNDHLLKWILARVSHSCLDWWPGILQEEEENLAPKKKIIFFTEKNKYS